MTREPDQPGARCAVINGASRGIGLEFVRQLLAAGVPRVVATCRNPEQANTLRGLAESPRLDVLAMDTTDEDTIASVAESLGREHDPVDLVINAAGLLHEHDKCRPERRLADVEPAAMLRSYQVNALGPLLVAKHFQRVLPRRGRAVFASLSARVGSVGDNRLGGWYAYRMAKAAQNMATRNLSIELRRSVADIICVAIHPGTVDTDLSRPFQKNLPDGQLQPVELAVARMLKVLSELRPDDNGSFYAFDGERLPW